MNVGVLERRLDQLEARVHSGILADSVLGQYEPSKTGAEFHASDEFVRGLLGPVGSGKSVACCQEIYRRAKAQHAGSDGVRRSRWVIVRNSYRELLDTTVRTWHDWFPRSLGSWRISEMTHILEHPMADGTHLYSEVLFRALDRPDDVKKLLSLELTGAWVNEAREVPRSVIDMLQSRVGRYPSKRDGGPAWFGVFLDSNPPDSDHWWYRLFEETRPAGWRLFHQPSGLAPEAENTENLPPLYYERMMAGKDDQWVQVYVHGQYGFVADGKSVYPEWHDHIHVQDIKLVENVPIYVGIDFGLTPAAVFGQQVGGHWNILGELVTEDMGAARFADLLGQRLRGEYQGHDLYVYGDPAGEQRAQTDERTPFDILTAAGIEAVPAPTNDFTIRREAVAAQLSSLAMDGRPVLRLNPACRVLRKAMGGGYSYRRLQVVGDERYHDKPDKSRFSHVAEALQYLLVGAGEGDQVVGHDNDDWAYEIN